MLTKKQEVKLRRLDKRILNGQKVARKDLLWAIDRQFEKRREAEAKAANPENGTSGQDRESYSDDQDRDNYT